MSKGRFNPLEMTFFFPAVVSAILVALELDDLENTLRAEWLIAISFCVGACLAMVLVVAGRHAGLSFLFSRGRLSHQFFYYVIFVVAVTFLAIEYPNRTILREVETLQTTVLTKEPLKSPWGQAVAWAIEVEIDGRIEELRVDEFKGPRLSVGDFVELNIGQGLFGFPFVSGINTSN